MLKIGGLSEISTVAPAQISIGSLSPRSFPVFPDTLASSTSSRLGAIPRFFRFVYRWICSFFPYPIKKKSPVQVMEDFEKSPYKVLEALLKFYCEDDKGAEELLVSMATELKRILLKEGKDSVYPKINETISQLVFPPEIQAIREKIIECEANWQEVQKFQNEERRFNIFLKEVMKKLRRQSALSSIASRFPRNFDWSFGEFIRVLVEQEPIQRLKYENSFTNARKTTNEVLTYILYIQQGKTILIDQYPNLKSMIFPIRAILTDPFKQQRLWSTISKLIDVFES